ncbi:MAG: Zinc transporter ZupT [Promethearchaeota archaeon CR_4]|nr:MAG: Zinc transporter ZupT [Candidatus Lokiarchaeota archaeon CR_4]
MDASQIGFAFLFSIIAGLSTGIGSLISLVTKQPSLKYLSFSLGLSAGVMLYVSFIELLPEGFESIGELGGLLLFLGGLGFGALIDKLLPEVKNPHHLQGRTPCNEYKELLTAEASPLQPVKDSQILVLPNPKGGSRRGGQRHRHRYYGGAMLAEQTEKSSISSQQLYRTGMLTAIIIAIHNFPEGIATFGSSLADLSLGILVTVAIAIHNIPEGISVSIPIYCATGDRKKAFRYSFLSGLAEPVGALLGFLVLFPIMSEAVLGGMLSFIAGIMIFIAVDELIPTAHNCGHGHAALLGLVFGMGIMAISIILI